MPKPQRSAVVFSCRLGLLPASAAGRIPGMTVRGGETDLGETPVVVELKRPRARRPLCRGVPIGRRFIRGPGLRGKGGRQLGAVLPRLDARQTITYALQGPAQRRRRFSVRPLVSSLTGATSRSSSTSSS